MKLVDFIIRNWEEITVAFAAVAHGVSKLFWIFKNGKQKTSGND